MENTDDNFAINISLLCDPLSPIINQQNSPCFWRMNTFEFDFIRSIGTLGLLFCNMYIGLYNHRMVNICFYYSDLSIEEAISLSLCLIYL